LSTEWLLKRYSSNWLTDCHVSDPHSLFVVDNSKAERELGYHPGASTGELIDLDAGLDERREITLRLTITRKRIWWQRNSEEYWPSERIRMMSNSCALARLAC
jgi:hypothetical protein